MYPTIGLDYHDTVTNDFRLFEAMCKAWREAGHKVYMVTALKHNYTNAAVDEREAWSKNVDAIEFCYFNDYSEIAELKLTICHRLNIGLMFDDSPAVCKLLSEHGIITAQIR